jgi:hypothetical protein
MLQIHPVVLRVFVTQYIPEDGCDLFLQKVGTFLPDHMESVETCFNKDAKCWQLDCTQQKFTRCHTEPLQHKHLCVSIFKVCVSP